MNGAIAPTERNFSVRTKSRKSYRNKVKISCFPIRLWTCWKRDFRHWTWTLFLWLTGFNLTKFNSQNLFEAISTEETDHFVLKYWTDFDNFRDEPCWKLFSVFLSSILRQENDVCRCATTWSENWLSFFVRLSTWSLKGRRTMFSYFILDVWQRENRS